MFNFENGVEFDPGFSPYVICFSELATSFEAMIVELKTPHQKKFKFQMLAPQLKKAFENVVAFYQGCLLWATYISRTFKDNSKNILNNSFYGRNIDNSDFLYEVNFLIDYFDKFDRDCKYFLGKTLDIPQKWREIAAIYKKFLEINNNFVNTATTADIKLPEEIPEDIDLEQTLKVIETSIQNQALETLLDVKL